MLDKFRIGHYTDLERATGCTVIVPPEINMASAAARGASPGSREYALLSPKRKISRISALVLTGGSAFGLNCAHGVMESMVEHGLGYQTNFGLVPIVPAAVIFDKNLGDATAYPTTGDGIRALESAKYNNLEMGNVGVGSGATVGKWRGMDFAMKGGLGLAHQNYQNIKVTALTVVNAVGDVLDKQGQIIAGAVSKEDVFLAKDDPFCRWDDSRIGLAENTLLTTIMTNVNLSKQQAHFVAERAHHGIARRIEPSHTGYDGDISFVISSQEVEGKVDLLASLVVSAVEESILNGIKQAQSIHGIRSWKDLNK